MAQTTLPAEQEDWDLVIEPQRALFDLRLKELWRYRDLVLLFVRRDFVAAYKQVNYLDPNLVSKLSYNQVIIKKALLGTDSLIISELYLISIIFKFTWVFQVWSPFIRIY